MHCRLDTNRPLHRSTNPARMRLNVWSMVITSCREQCPPPGLQQRADSADEQQFTAACFLCAELFLLCNKWEKTREVRSKPRHAAEVFVLSAHQLHSLHVKLCFQLFEMKEASSSSQLPLWTRPRCFSYCFCLTGSFFHNLHKQKQICFVSRSDPRGDARSSGDDVSPAIIGLF